jgi:hypothetical protein
MCERTMPCPACEAQLTEQEETACHSVADVIMTTYQCRACGAMTSVTTIPLPTTADAGRFRVNVG